MNESHWNGADHRQVRRVRSIQELSDETIWDEPFIVPSEVLPSHEFVHVPNGVDIVDYIVRELADCEVQVGERCVSTSFREWFDRLRSDPQMYLRDLHVNRLKQGFKLFETPKVFSDWLNEYCNAQPNQGPRPVLDFQFMYWGAKASRTPFHRDVMGTFSWSHNLRGKKYWKFFHTNHVVFECFQSPGETVFVPSQCFHTVENMCDDTISVNQNWINEFNIHEVAEQLVLDAKKVREDLLAFGATDDNETSDQVEQIVWANNALNLTNLLYVIQFALTNRDMQTLSSRGKQNMIKAVELMNVVHLDPALYRNIRDRLGYPLCLSYTVIHLSN